MTKETQMSSPTRIRGKQLKLTLGSPGVEYKCDTTQVVLEREDADEDLVTFCDAEQPGTPQQEYLTIAAIQSTDPDSLWAYLWGHAGEEVAFVYAPWGNEEPTPAQPHFLGTCILGPRPTLGGEAGRDNTYSFETRWDLVSPAVMDDGTIPEG
jgi:hypothetical protein